MPYDVDTSDPATGKFLRKRWLKEENTEDGVLISVVQRKGQPLRRCGVLVLIIIGITLLTQYLVATPSEKGGSLWPILLMLMSMMIIAGCGFALALGAIPALCIAMFGRKVSRFVVSNQGIVLLNAGGSLRKKLLPWGHIDGFWAQEGRDNQTTGEYSGGGTAFVYSGPIGGIAAGATVTAHSVGELALRALTYVFSGSAGKVKIRYKNKELALAERLSYPEALCVLHAVERAQQQPASAQAA